MTNHVSEDQQGSFDPGPSFTEGTIPTPDPAMLPSWLQRFGESTAADAPAQAAEPEPAPESVPDEQVNEATDGLQIPAWLQESPDPVADSASEPVSASAPEGFEGFSGSDFLTDDDLPDWLRSIGTQVDVELPDSSQQEDAPAAAPATPTATATIPVPKVRRVWVTDQDVPEVSSGASMFAAVAEGVGSRPDILVADAAGQESPATTAAPAATQAIATNAVPSEKAKTEDSGSQRMRLLLVAAIAIVVILLLVMALGN